MSFSLPMHMELWCVGRLRNGKWHRSIGRIVYASLSFFLFFFLSSLSLSRSLISVVSDLPMHTHPPTHVRTWQGLRSVCWLPDGKKFMSGHTHGGLALWNARSSGEKPLFHTSLSCGVKGGSDIVYSITCTRGKDNQSALIFVGVRSRSTEGSPGSLVLLQVRTSFPLSLFLGRTCVRQCS